MTSKTKLAKIILLNVVIMESTTAIFPFPVTAAQYLNVSNVLNLKRSKNFINISFDFYLSCNKDVQIQTYLF